MYITSNTGLNILIGFPLTHSQSPLMHQIIYRELGEDAVLLAQPHLSLPTLIQAIKNLSIKLTAVTRPYKEQVMPYVDEYSPEVAELKAVNTIIQRNGRLYGYNTDIDGIAFALGNVNVNNKHVLIIGGGGAARAMGYYLATRQARIFWMNRTQAKAQQLAIEFGGKVIINSECQRYRFDIIVNTTPLGVTPNVHICALANYTFQPQQIVFDMVYNPVQTALLQQAKAQQAIVISGIDMFIGQGIKQIELLTGKKYLPEKISFLRNTLILHQSKSEFSIK